MRLNINGIQYMYNLSYKLNSFPSSHIGKFITKPLLTPTCDLSKTNLLLKKSNATRKVCLCLRLDIHIE